MNVRPIMTALMLEAHAAPFDLAQVPRPTPAAGEVLVRIQASGVNPLDIKIRAGAAAAAHARRTLPAILGIDLAGVVEQVGPGVSRFRRGDEVYGMTGGVGGAQGTLAQFASVDADLLAHKPANLSMREAAALPLVTITAWEALVDRDRISKGQTVLVHGGAGGIGHVAIQLARAQGATVWASGRAADAQTIADLGATPIDFETESVRDYVARHGGGGFDVVFDTVGGASLDASFAAVRRFGHVVSAMGWGVHALAPLSFKEASYSGVYTLTPLLTGEGRAHHGEILERARRLAEAGRLAPILDPRRFTFADIETAYAAVGARAAKGKVVVSPPDAG